MTRVSHTAPKKTNLKTATEDMKTRKGNSGVQSGRRKRAGGKRSSEPAPTSKCPRRHPIEALVFYSLVSSVHFPMTFISTVLNKTN